MHTALITGVAGQDGSYLAELLLAQGYRVVGAVSSLNTALWRIEHLRERIELVELDLLDARGLCRTIEICQPREIYNLAARASSAHLFDMPRLTAEINGLAVTNLLGAIRAVNPGIRFCQASSSEMFGNAVGFPQNEATPFRPRNPYGAAKLYAHWMTAISRDSDGLFACSAILFNHESPRRTGEFVTRKITRAAADIAAGRASSLTLQDLEARRDWGFAGDYVEAMWKMLQAPVAADYVLATGKLHSVRDFCEIAFARAGLDYRNHVTSAGVPRRSESVPLVGDAGKAGRELGWSPRVDFTNLVHMMVDADVKAVAAPQ